MDPASSQPACCHLCQHLRLTCVPPIMRPSLHPSLPCFWPVWHRSSHACCIEWLASPSMLLCSLASTQSGRHRPVTCGLHRMVWSQTGISLPCFCAPFQASSLPALGPGTAARSHRLRQGLRHVARPTWWIWHGDRPPCRGGAATRRRPPCRGKARRAVVVFYDWVIQTGSCFDPMHAWGPTTGRQLRQQRLSFCHQPSQPAFQRQPQEEAPCQQYFPKQS